MYSMFMFFRVQKGREQEFRQLARRIWEHDREQGYQVPRLYRPVNANGSRFLLEVRYPNRAELQAEQKRQDADRVWQRLVARAEATFVPGSQEVDLLHTEA